MISDAEFKRRINRGIKLLDKKYGKKWREKIVLGTLDLADGSHCVLGQTDSNYTDHSHALGLSDRSAARLGFFSQAKNFDNYERESERLTALWKAALRRRGCK